MFFMELWEYSKVVVESMKHACTHVDQNTHLLKVVVECMKHALHPLCVHVDQISCTCYFLKGLPNDMCRGVDKRMHPCLL
jgi:hypothetical protein